MILEFSIFKSFSDRLSHGVTTKISDTPNELIFGNQVHGDNVIFLNKKPDHPFEGDAFVTQKSNIPLSVQVADCQGVLMFDPKTQTIAAIHSGWRGSSLNIIGKTIETMRELGVSPSDLIVGISPSLGPCCAEFTDPKNELPDFIHPFISNRNVDLWSLSLDQLKNAGVPKSQIEIIKECTKCQPDKYFSHRNADTGRMAVFISLK